MPKNIIKMKVGLLIGSIRQGRQSHKIGHYLANQLEARQHEPQLLDLAALSLPLLEERVSLHPALPQTVKELSGNLHQADALILITPEYHGSFSGVIKNALDYFSAEFYRKATGIVAVSAGKLGGVSAANQLQQVVNSAGGIAVPTKLLVPEVYGAFNEKMELVNEHTIRSAKKFLDDFEWLATAINEKKSVPAG
ncbi:NAD(P)H-dependent FMN reductase [Chitinophaga terrae (ex Kim and Jung 2007)]|uniref:NAD(P)H-dependent FMN reductase n=2 Tax=Chitinophaga terrae (ex Kim and Jung 2007) TaxID=408074 RepID=A0A1H3YRU6_9BACT|nr:NADPH-dependent FMN reductase [Chitinophaga terrae (ex Kim and Jung 2007)]SEA14246.1 NAD(P)H-dependent FMN reductase [Chitinophaga terrae (ex Kim and Jung 2007)]